MAPQYEYLVGMVAILAVTALVTFGFHTINTMKIPLESSEPREVTLNIKSNKPVTISPNTIQKTMNVASKHGTLSQMTFIEGDTAYIGMFSAITTYVVSSLWQDIIVIYMTTDIRNIEIVISSPGGSAFEGLALTDYIEKAQRMGFTITAYATGIVASAAVPVFAVATKRIASESTVFMIHPASIFKWPGSETQSDIIAQTRMLEMLQLQYLNKLANHSNKSVAEWKAMEKQTTWFDAKQAQKWGLVDDIEE